MDHERRVLRVVRAHVRQSEPRRHLGIELDRPHLPRATEHVGHVQVDLRAVEGAVALVHLVVDAAPVERAPERGFREIPLLVGSELLLGPGRELEPRLHPEQVVEVRGVVEAAEDLVLDLLRRAEHVRVVLGDVLDAEQAVQRSAALVAMERRRLRKAHGQLPIAA